MDAIAQLSLPPAVSAVHGANLLSPAFLPAEHPSQTAAALLVEALVGAGADTFFGVPGGTVMQAFDAILCNRRARLIESRHENNAVFSAIGYNRATGSVPVVIVTSGPGATNLFTGLASAYLERVPMVVICGDVAWSSSGGRLLQSLGREGVGIDDALRNVTRAVVRVAGARSAASQGLAALSAAVAPNSTGPSLLVLPIDCGASPTKPNELVYVPNVQKCSPPSEHVLRVARLLADARRPLVVEGAGCRAHAQAVRLAIEALRLPFMTTPRAKGLISEAHPLSLRNGGMAASWWARRYTSAAGGADVTLVLGTDLDDVSVGPTPPIGVGGHLIHVDLDAEVFGRNHPTGTALRCELGAFSQHLAELAMERGLFNHRATDERALAVAASPFDKPDFHSDNTANLAPHRAIHDLQQAAGNATFFSDIGEHMLFALHYLTARRPDDFVIHLGLGSMTSGICSAVGYAFGERSRRVICICGDGGMQMAGTEILVAARLRLAIVYAVFNDGRYNMVFHGYRQQFGREAGWDSPWIDFVAWARAMGIPGARIDAPGQLNSGLLDHLTAEGTPAILDIRHDPNVRISGAGRVEALQHMSAATPALVGR